MRATSWRNNITGYEEIYLRKRKVYITESAIECRRRSYNARQSRTDRSMNGGPKPIYPRRGVHKNRFGNAVPIAAATVFHLEERHTSFRYSDRALLQTVHPKRSRLHL